MQYWNRGIIIDNKHHNKPDITLTKENNTTPLWYKFLYQTTTYIKINKTYSPNITDKENVAPESSAHDSITYAFIGITPKRYLCSIVHPLELPNYISIQLQKLVLLDFYSTVRVLLCKVFCLGIQFHDPHGKCVFMILVRDPFLLYILWYVSFSFLICYGSWNMELKG